MKKYFIIGFLAIASIVFIATQMPKVPSFNEYVPHKNYADDYNKNALGEGLWFTIKNSAGTLVNAVKVVGKDAAIIGTGVYKDAKEQGANLYNGAKDSFENISNSLSENDVFR